MTRIISSVQRIDVLVDGTPAGSLERTESLEKIALTTFDVESKFIYGRTIIRALVKMVAGIATRATGDVIGGTGGEILNIISSGVQVANNITEQADTRSVRYYPSTVWTGDIELPSTDAHVITLVYAGIEGQELARREYTTKAPQSISQITLVTDAFLQ